MYRKVVTGLLMAVTGVALSGAALAPNHEVRALPICVGEQVSGVVSATAGPYCVPFPYGVNCQETEIGFIPTIDTKTYTCVPRP